MANHINKFQQLVKARLEADTWQNRVRGYLEDLCNKNDRYARMFQTSSARDSQNGTLALDLASLTFAVIAAAKTAGDDEIVNTLLPKDVQNVINTYRLHLSLTAAGQRAFMLSLARSEERKGLKNTAGQA